MKKYFVLFLSLLVVSCATGEGDLKYHQYQIFSIALDESVGHDSMYRKHLKIPPYFYLPSDNDFDSLEFRKYKRWRDSLQVILDTATFYVVVNSKLDKFLAKEIVSAGQKITLRGGIIRSDLDTFQMLLERPTLAILDSINVDSLKSKYSYKILKNSTDPNDKVRKVGSVHFSNVIFNSDRSYAVLSTAFVCGDLCGGGKVFFFKRMSGRWVLLDMMDTWVS